MKIGYETGVGEAVFDVNRNGLEVEITIDSRLSVAQVFSSALLALEPCELVEFTNLAIGAELALNGSHTG